MATQQEIKSKITELNKLFKKVKKAFKESGYDLNDPKQSEVFKKIKINKILQDMGDTEETVYDYINVLNEKLRYLNDELTKAKTRTNKTYQKVQEGDRKADEGFKKSERLSDVINKLNKKVLDSMPKQEAKLEQLHINMLSEREGYERSQKKYTSHAEIILSNLDDLVRTAQDRESKIGDLRIITKTIKTEKDLIESSFKDGEEKESLLRQYAKADTTLSKYLKHRQGYFTRIGKFLEVNKMTTAGILGAMSGNNPMLAFIGGLLDKRRAETRAVNSAQTEATKRLREVVRQGKLDKAYARLFRRGRGTEGRGSSLFGDSRQQAYGGSRSSSNDVLSELKLHRNILGDILEQSVSIKKYILLAYQDSKRNKQDTESDTMESAWESAGERNEAATPKKAKKLKGGFFGEIIKDLASGLIGGIGGGLAVGGAAGLGATVATIAGGLIAVAGGAVLTGIEVYKATGKAEEWGVNKISAGLSAVTLPALGALIGTILLPGIGTVIGFAAGSIANTLAPENFKKEMAIVIEDIGSFMRENLSLISKGINQLIRSPFQSVKTIIMGAISWAQDKFDFKKYGIMLMDSFKSIAKVVKWAFYSLLKPISRAVKFIESSTMPVVNIIKGVVKIIDHIYSGSVKIIRSLSEKLEWIKQKFFQLTGYHLESNESFSREWKGQHDENMARSSERRRARASAASQSAASAAAAYAGVDPYRTEQTSTSMYPEGIMSAPQIGETSKPTGGRQIAASGSTDGITPELMQSRLIESLKAEGITDKRAIANIMAQAEVETSPSRKGQQAWIPRTEDPSQYASSRDPYPGAGLIQLSGIRNYRMMTKELQKRGYNVDLVKNPELANHPDLVGPIAAIYFKKNLSFEKMKNVQSVNRAMGFNAGTNAGMRAGSGGPNDMKRSSVADKWFDRLTKDSSSASQYSSLNSQNQANRMSQANNRPIVNVTPPAPIRQANRGSTSVNSGSTRAAPRGNEPALQSALNTDFSGSFA